MSSFNNEIQCHGYSESSGFKVQVPYDSTGTVCLRSLTGLDGEGFNVIAQNRWPVNVRRAKKVVRQLWTLPSLPFACKPSKIKFKSQELASG
jgi:hypothetical protein